MLRKTVTLLFVISLTVPAMAQSTAAYVGQVKGSNIYVRSGPSQNYYPMVQLSRPARVIVVGIEDGWLKIVPPPGTYSLVNKTLVKVQGDVGTITGDNVNVRAGSDMRPRDFSKVQVTLHKADQVTVLGQTEEHYKITPPPGVVLYIHADYIEQMAGEPAVLPPGYTATSMTPAEATTQATTTQPVLPGMIATQPSSPIPGGIPLRNGTDAGTVTQVARGVRSTTGPATMPATEGDTAATIKAWEAAEAALKAEYDKPAGQPDPAKILAMYKAIKVGPNSQLKEVVPYRISWLQNEINRQNVLAQAKRVLNDAHVEGQQAQAELEKIQAEQAKNEGPLAYTAQGKLVTSEMFSGMLGIPRRWAVMGDGRIMAYVQSSTGVVNLANFEGKNVGLFGTRQYDPRFMLFIVDVSKVEDIVVLPEGGRAMLPVKAAAPVIPPPPAPPVVVPPASQPTTAPAPVAPVFSVIQADTTQPASAPATTNTSPDPDFYN